jgi:tetratricopeptide (TPR) repeat protein
MLVRLFLVGVFIFYLIAGWSKASDALDRAYESYLLGDYHNSLFEGLDVSSDPKADEALYLSGMSYFKLGRYPEARNCFRKIIKSFRRSKFYKPSLVKLGDVYFLEGSYKRARSVYRAILNENLAKEYKPLVYLRLAQIAAKLGEWSQEKKYIRIIKNEYPHSIEREYADILEDRGYFFTIQVGAFSYKNNALALREELEARYPVYLVKEKLGDLVLYKVRVGKFKSRKQVEAIQRSLIEEGYPARIYP